MRYFREVATGDVSAAGRNEARLFAGAPDGFEEVQVVPVGATVVELPEVVHDRMDGRSSAWTQPGSQGSANRPFYCFPIDCDLDREERFSLFKLAAIRAEREHRRIEAENVVAAEEEKREREIQDAAQRIANRLPFPSMGEKARIADLLRAGVIAEVPR